VQHRKDDLRDCPTAYECRDRLPELAAWMSDEMLKELPIWQPARFERGQEYFDLDHPERGPFVATGDEGFPTDHTYVCRNQTTERAWAQLITWRRPIGESEGQQIEYLRRELGIGRQQSGAGEARPLPPD
jgi:hypothetical protein